MVLVHYWENEGKWYRHIEANDAIFLDTIRAIYSIAKGLQMNKDDLQNVLNVWDILTEEEEDENK